MLPVDEVFTVYVKIRVRSGETVLYFSFRFCAIMLVEV